MSYGYPIPITKFEKKRPNAVPVVPVTDDADDSADIASCIAAFKGPIVALFAENDGIESFKLVPHSQAQTSVTLYRDKVCFEKDAGDGAVKSFVIDFASHSLKSEFATIRNLNSLKQLMIYFHQLYKDFLAQKATLYESEIDANQY